MRLTYITKNRSSSAARSCTVYYPVANMEECNSIEAFRRIDAEQENAIAYDELKKPIQKWRKKMQNQVEEELQRRHEVSGVGVQ